MANLKDIRRRISSVKNTQQITKAMKMIAAVKLRKAQDQILAARPYAQELISVIANLALHGETKYHPLLVRRKIKNGRVFVVTSDRGQCGGYNANIIRQTEHFLKEKKETFQDLKVCFIGKKGYEYFNKKLDEKRVGHYYEGVMGEPHFEHALKIADELMDEYTQAKLDHVFFVYNEFKSAMNQHVVVETLLPVRAKAEEQALSKVDYLYEPSKKDVLSALLPKHIRIQVYRILLEASSSEHGARMTAMDNASKNAAEMIDKLTLIANRVRQAAITTELMEIVGGAEALKA
ncbi:MAG: ATP synthase F1 subunit gamma [Deltaproteobacteria bacterium]|nr:ATP synthase F1 subunit gamma [Deltaproteobacteria bacterium]